MYLLDWMDVEASGTLTNGKKAKIHDNLELLLDFAGKGHITIYISSRFLTDKIQDRNTGRRKRDKRLLSILSSRPGVVLKASTFAFDMGWGSFASMEDRCLRRLLERILYPEGINVGHEEHWRNKASDVDHLRDAIISHCSHFLTAEKRFHNHSSELWKRLGIRILRLDGFLSGFKGQHDRPPKRRFSHTLGDS